MKPYSEACDQNKTPILDVIAPILVNCTSLLEVGSGTGQHALFFAERFPHLVWQTSDREDYHEGINQWITESGVSNVCTPLLLDVSHYQWKDKQYDAIFSANTTHIMHWEDVEAFFSGVGHALNAPGDFLLYDPFNYNNSYTSQSNARFDVWLKQRDPKSGIRDANDLNDLATQAGLVLQHDYAMPANNRLLHWRKG